ncbi:hypothetical protein CesoFtcFv8_017716 [Champsocephalus esox]|uniref:Uncharacterized protein n=2 Tax=Champsocephalus TaxID=52236 RepID=A0AAN8D7Y3_CHAGU|nr:hypothetical protein CesoFtcFv8_017716 [Champsocephalus esox]KAK5917174.1 hypothetical protein CgunFtcFv8_012084 [Champsocephalus gunnari]
MLYTYLLSALCPHTSSLTGSQLGRPDRRVERYLSDAARNSPELCWDQERRAFLPPQPSLTHPQQKQQRSGRGKTIPNPESLTPGSTRSSQRVESEVQDSELIPLFLSGLQCELACSFIITVHEVGLQEKRKSCLNESKVDLWIQNG